MSRRRATSSSNSNAAGTDYLVRTDAAGAPLVQTWPEMQYILANASDKLSQQAILERWPGEEDPPGPLDPVALAETGRPAGRGLPLGRRLPRRPLPLLAPGPRSSALARRLRRRRGKASLARPLRGTVSPPARAAAGRVMGCRRGECRAASARSLTGKEAEKRPRSCILWEKLGLVRPSDCVVVPSHLPEQDGVVLVDEEVRPEIVRGRWHGGITVCGGCAGGRGHGRRSRTIRIRRKDTKAYAQTGDVVNCHVRKSPRGGNDARSGPVLLAQGRGKSPARRDPGRGPDPPCSAGAWRGPAFPRLPWSSLRQADKSRRRGHLASESP